MDDDSDDSSQIETLDQFRQKWQNELKTTKQSQSQKQTTKSAIPLTLSAKNVDDDEKAKNHQVTSRRLLGKREERREVNSIAIYSHLCLLG